MAGVKLAPAAGPQVFVVSKDGAQVPMFVVAPVNTSLDGTYPTVLYGYGGAPAVTSQLFTSSLLLAGPDVPMRALKNADICQTCRALKDWPASAGCLVELEGLQTTCCTSWRGSDCGAS